MPLPIEEIRRRVEATDSGVLLVPSRILRRVIKRHRQIPAGLDVPHASSYVVAKEELLAIASADELGKAALDLPAHVILLPRPEEGDAADSQELLVRLWRSAFHASIHRALEERISSGALSPAAIRARVHRVGQTELDEARLVLRQDDLLLSPHDAGAVYVELIATYLELFHFAPDQLARTFPALGDHQTMSEVIAPDLDALALLEACRPEGTPPIGEIAARTRVESDEAIRGHGRARAQSVPDTSPAPRRTTGDEPADVTRRAAVAEKRGNLVRAMLIRARVGTRGEAGARNNLVTLGKRLAAALEWPDAPVTEWANTLYPLLPAAHARALPWNAEARLLYDLLRACVDHEREIFTVSVAEWALSLGDRPVRRALPAQREVRVSKHIASAMERIESVRLDERPRQNLEALLETLASRAEDNTRRKLRPRLRAALREVGLVAKNVPEQASEHKMVEELIDHVVAHRFLSLGQLRDAISRNHIKLPTLRARELVFGDALLEVDRILSRSLDGVYRRAEVYVRGLQKLSSIMFGTVPGRLLVLYLLLPVVCAYVLLEGVQHVVVGPLVAKIPHVPEPDVVSWPTMAIASAVIFILIHSRNARFLAQEGLKGAGAILRFFLIRLPGWFWRRKLVQAIVKSKPVQLVVRFVVKPALVTAVASTIIPFLPIEPWVAACGAATVFVLANVVLNSRMGAMLEETATDWTVRTWQRLHRRIIPGLFSLVIAVFRRMIELMDRAIYAVDELLRFRQGEGRATYFLKGGLGIVWFVLTYAVRLYVNLLVEPEINPIKHFPVVTVAAKLMIPITPLLHRAMSVPLTRLLGPFVGEAIAVSTVFVLPGFFGFLVWELKENWKIYEQNRARELNPVVIGRHGETMIALMRPGLHSGTLPKIYRKLRRASQNGKHALHEQREELGHVERALRHFVERELVDLLDRSKRWKGGHVVIGQIAMASNRVRIVLGCPSVAETEAEITFEEQSGLLLGSVSRAGFLDRLDDEQRIVFENALAGLYKVAGVDLVRERASACLGGAPYDVADEGLLVWPGGTYVTEVTYDLKGHGVLRPIRDVGEPRSKDKPTLDAHDLLYGSVPILWTDWVAAWKADSTARLISGPSLLPPRLASGS